MGKRGDGSVTRPGTGVCETLHSAKGGAVETESSDLYDVMY